jgi:hypothetical protein
VKLLCHANHDHLDWVHHHLDPAWILHDAVRAITRACLRHVPEDGSLAAVLGALADHPVALQLVTQAASDPRPIPDIPRQLADAARKFRDAWIERRIATVGSRLADPSLDHEAKVAALREQQELRALRRAPLAAISDV